MKKQNPFFSFLVLCLIVNLTLSPISSMGIVTMEDLLPSLLLGNLAFPTYMEVKAAEAESSIISSAPEKVEIRFLHDTHSHLNSFLTVEEGEPVTLGGFSRIKTLIDETPQKPLILDAGDFSMGTLVQTISHSDAPELRMLGALGCDVTTLGNHEFDYRSEGLAGMLTAAATSNDPVPAMVLCNIDWESMEAEGLTEEQKMLKDAFDIYGMKDYVMLQWEIGRAHV